MPPLDATAFEDAEPCYPLCAVISIQTHVNTVGLQMRQLSPVQLTRSLGIGIYTAIHICGRAGEVGV